jgi:hypothetical protein
MTAPGADASLTSVQESGLRETPLQCNLPVPKTLKDICDKKIRALPPARTALDSTDKLPNPGALA